MAPLKNPRHEKFTQALAEGRSAHQAYIDAGYKPCRQNAARLTTKDDIKARLTELQEAAAKDNAITIQSICTELDTAVAVATARGQASAMVSASALRAKLAGLGIERIEIGGPNEFANCKTEAETVDKLLEIEAPGIPFTGEERAKLRELLAAVAEFINSRKAKPGNSPAYPSQRTIELARGNGFRRIGR
jgi:Terminase small subunit